MTYLHRYHCMSDDELVDWAQGLFDRAALFPEGTADLTELRNITPFLIERLRQRIQEGQEFVEIPRIDAPAAPPSLFEP